MKKMILGLAVLLFLGVGPAQGNKGVTPMLKMDTTYNFIFGAGFITPATFVERPDDLQYALVWEGTILGDVDGVIRWWAEYMPEAGGPGLFTGAGRFEVWDCDPVYPAIDCLDPAQLVMAGYEVFAYVSQTDWEGKGIVTYVNPNYPEYAEWFGRRTNDGGYVNFVGGFPSDGAGWFTIYNRPSNKH
jgi:hypothetical protein